MRGFSDPNAAVRANSMFLVGVTEAVQFRPGALSPPTLQQRLLFHPCAPVHCQIQLPPAPSRRPRCERARRSRSPTTKRALSSLSFRRGFVHRVRGLPDAGRHEGVWAAGPEAVRQCAPRPAPRARTRAAHRALTLCDGRRSGLDFSGTRLILTYRNLLSLPSPGNFAPSFSGFLKQQGLPQCGRLALSRVWHDEPAIGDIMPTGASFAGAALLGGAPPLPCRRGCTSE